MTTAHFVLEPKTEAAFEEKLDEELAELEEDLEDLEELTEGLEELMDARSCSWVG